MVGLENGALGKSIIPVPVQEEVRITGITFSLLVYHATGQNRLARPARRGWQLGTGGHLFRSRLKKKRSSRRQLNVQACLALQVQELPGHLEH